MSHKILIGASLLGALAGAPPAFAESLSRFAAAVVCDGIGASPLPLDLFSFSPDEDLAGELLADALSVEDWDPEAGTGNLGIPDLAAGARVPLELAGFAAVELRVAEESIPFEVDTDCERAAVTFHLSDFPLEIGLKSRFLRPPAGVEQVTLTPLADVHLDVIYPGGAAAPGIRFEHREGAGAGGGGAAGIPLRLDQPFSIGDTGLTVESATVSLVPPFGIELESVKISFQEGSLLAFLNKLLPEDPEDLAWSARIEKGGLSGSFSFRPDSPLPGTLFTEDDFKLVSLDLAFEQNAITSGKVVGKLTPPFFRQSELTIELSLQEDGNVRAALDFDPGSPIVFEVDGVFRLAVKGIDFELHGDDDYRFRIDGDLSLLFPASYGGSSIEDIPIERLLISSAGEIALDGGWVRLPRPETFDFHGFEIAVRAISFGSDEESEESWIGLDADVNLTETLPLRGAVHGLRVVFKGGALDRIALDGIGIDFRLSGVASFLGDVRWAGSGEPGEGDSYFQGAVRLSIEAIGLGVDAFLTVGKTGGTRFFFVSLFSEFPAGVPIFSGVSLYGLGGLFASNLQPNIDGFDTPLLWYTEHEDRTNRGDDLIAGDLAPWNVVPGALSFGAGALIGSADNGYAVHVKAALLVSIPGPLVSFNGKGNILKKRGSLGTGGEPIFNAYATVTPEAVEMGVGINYELASVIKIQGDAEAFFSLEDTADWHVYIGSIGGREIQAKVVEFLRAKAYFMVHPKAEDILDPPVGGSPFSGPIVPDLAFGAGIGFDVDYSIGPLGIALRALIAGWAAINFDPIHFQGGMDLAGGVELRAFGFSLGIDVGADLSFETPTPFEMDGSFRVRLKLPWPLPDPKATVRLHWGNDAEPAPLSPIIKEVNLCARDGSHGVSARLSQAEEALPRSELGVAEGEAARAPLVPLDFAPNVLFHRPMNDSSGQGFTGAMAERCVADIVRNKEGAETRYSYYATQVEVSTQPYLPETAEYAAFEAADAQPEGAWHPELGSESDYPGRVLVLYDDNPFSHLESSGFAPAAGGGGGGAGNPPVWLPRHGLAERLWRRSCAPCPCYPCEPAPRAPCDPHTTQCHPPPDPGDCNERCQPSDSSADPDTGAGAPCIHLPYTVYRIKVVTKVHKNALPGDEGDFICESGSLVLTPNADDITLTETHYAHYYTQGPPLDLTPYVHEVLPADPAIPHLRSYHLAVRFNRNYIHLLYEDPRVDLEGARVCGGNPSLIVRVLDSSGNLVGDVSTAAYFGKAEDAVNPAGLREDDADPGDDFLNDDILHVPVDGVALRPGERYVLQIAWRDARLAWDRRLEGGAPPGVKLLGADEVSLFEHPFRASRYLGLRELFATFRDSEEGCDWSDASYHGRYFELPVTAAGLTAAEDVLELMAELEADHPGLAHYASRLRDAHPSTSPRDVDDGTLLPGWSASRNWSGSTARRGTPLAS